MDKKRPSILPPDVRHEAAKPWLDEDRHRKVRICGNVIEFRTAMKLPKGMPITKWDDETYLVNATGELKQYDRTESRAENIASLLQSFGNARAIINANFRGGENELWITLTYRENMTDTKRLYVDFKRFMMRMRYQVNRELAYFIVVEPQGRGAWHVHGLIKTLDELPLRIENDDLARMWAQGFVGVQRLQGVDNVGAYVTAYCTNLPGDHEKTSEHMVKKRSRLAMYPPGMNFYRYSRTLTKPEWQELSTVSDDIKKVVESAKPNYYKEVELIDENKEVLNRFTYRQYNLVKPLSQDMVPKTVKRTIMAPDPERPKI